MGDLFPPGASSAATQRAVAEHTAQKVRKFANFRTNAGKNPPPPPGWGSMAVASLGEWFHSENQKSPEL